MFSFSAFSSLLLPGFSPRMRAVVVLVTEEVTVAPRARSLSSADSLSMDSRVPEMIYDFPDNGKLSVISSRGDTPSDFSSSRVLRLSSSAK